jgi:stage II sporulation protein D
VLRLISIGALLCITAVPAIAQTVRIGVFGLFHPTELRINGAPGTQLELLDPQITAHEVRVSLDAGALLVSTGDKEWRAQQLSVRGEFQLIVSGKISRAYRGTVHLRAERSELEAVLQMELEDAVARIVHSESGTRAPLEAMKAQAIAARSYLLGAPGRHINFDFCDTTHCQLLREAPPAGSPAMRATRETAGMTLTYGGKPLHAMYAKSCGGNTKTAAAIGLVSQNAYPYYVVATSYCERNPDAWRRTLPRSAVTAESPAWGFESFRLAITRKLGWNAIPSNSYSIRDHSSAIELRGSGHGHGLGLCQRGAAAMALGGADFRTILQHYYPNTKLESSTP